MAYERLRNAPLTRTLTDVLGDLSDLVQKEVRLASAEIKQTIATGVQASVWMMIAGVFGLLAGLLVVAAIVFGIASYGIALHWSCLIVAIALAVAAAVAFAYGRSLTNDKLMPTRSLRQINEAVKATKEQLT
jgi:VIT1/CCC1 family predicted Fe2+/Mn2+ transporter